jgi:metal-sulfur cluster biosynthetic enzyme
MAKITMTYRPNGYARFRPTTVDVVGAERTESVLQSRIKWATEQMTPEHREQGQHYRITVDGRLVWDSRNV